MLSGVVEAVSVFGAVEMCVDTALFGKICDSCDGGAVLTITAKVIMLLTTGIGIVAVIGIMVAGIRMLTAGKNAERLAKAKKRIIQIVVGLACYAVLFLITSFFIPGGIISTSISGTSLYCKEKTATKIDVDYPSDTGSSGDATASSTTGGDSQGSDSSSGSSPVAGATETYTFKKEKYVIAKPKTSLKDYMSYIKKFKVEQDKQACKKIGDSTKCSSSTRDNDKCLSFAETYVHDMYFGTYTSDWCASQYKRSYDLQDIKDEKLSVILKRAYEEINQGRPVVILVHYVGSSSRHFVAMVGYRASVKSADSITKNDLLLLNTKNGLTRAGGGKLEVIKDTHSPHLYRIRVIRSSSLKATRKNIDSC